MQLLILNEMKQLLLLSFSNSLVYTRDKFAGNTREYMVACGSRVHGGTREYMVPCGSWCRAAHGAMRLKTPFQHRAYYYDRSLVQSVTPYAVFLSHAVY